MNLHLSKRATVRRMYNGGNTAQHSTKQLQNWAGLLAYLYQRATKTTYRSHGPCTFTPSAGKPVLTSHARTHAFVRLISISCAWLGSIARSACGANAKHCIFTASGSASCIRVHEGFDGRRDSERPGGWRWGQTAAAVMYVHSRSYSETQTPADAVGGDAVQHGLEEG